MLSGMLEFIVKKSETNDSVLDFLQRRISAAPAAYLRQILKKGKIRKNGGLLVDPDALVPGDSITVPESDRMLVWLEKSPELDIIFENREILALNKPSKLAIHLSRGHERDNLCDRVNRLLQNRGESFTAAPIHRLDLETSGVVLFGKGKQACSRLGQIFMERSVSKTYLVLVRGAVAEQGTLESMITAKGKNKFARTDYSPLAWTAKASLLKLQLHTGRQHQIRKQLAAIGHPLFGDKRYGGPSAGELNRLFLHCAKLEFIDPVSTEWISIEADIPDELIRFSASIGLSTSSDGIRNQ